MIRDNLNYDLLLGLQTTYCVISICGEKVGVRFCAGKVVAKCVLTEKDIFRVIAKCGVVT